MKIGLLIRDSEYRNALLEIISEYDRDVFAEIAGTSGASAGSVILTDISPDELDSVSLRKIAPRTLFLDPVRHEDTDHKDIRTVFKYADVQTIMSELSVLHAEWTGEKIHVDPLSRTIAVISDYDYMCSERCRAVARQIIYHHGGSLIILPLGFINDYGTSDGEDTFSRLMYMIDSGCGVPAGSYIETDSYGISSVRMRKGLNPAARLSGDYLNKFISGAGSGYETIILDIGTAFRKENMEVLDKADHIIGFCTDLRCGGPEKIIGSENAARACIIRDFGISEADEAAAIDECVRKIYDRK